MRVATKALYAIGRFLAFLFSDIPLLVEARRWGLVEEYPGAQRCERCGVSSADSSALGEPTLGADLLAGRVE